MSVTQQPRHGTGDQGSNPRGDGVDEQQAQLKIVSEMMGHTRIAITQDLYTHVSAQMQRQAASAMDLLLAAPGEEVDRDASSTTA